MASQTNVKTTERLYDCHGHSESKDDVLFIQPNTAGESVEAELPKVLAARALIQATAGSVEPVQDYCVYVGLGAVNDVNETERYGNMAQIIFQRLTSENKSGDNDQ